MVDDFSSRYYGVVKCYYLIKGYGFIQREKGKDLFFLRTDARSGAVLVEGASVIFSISDEKNGPRAKDIERVG